MLLRYYDRADIEAYFDADTGALGIRPSADHRQLLRDAEGGFTILAGRVLVLARTSGGLVLHAGSRSAPLNALSVEVSSREGGRVLQIRWPAGDVDRLGYVVSGWIDSDPTPHIDDEHFDFGLFLQNVRSDPDRQRRMCGLSRD